MRLKNQNQTKPGLSPSLERYHKTTIKPEDIKHLEMKVYDNEPELKPVYDDGRYKVICNIWTTNDKEQKPNWVLRNKLSKYKTFKNGMYTDVQKAWYVDKVHKASALEQATPNECKALHCWLGTTNPNLRMPCFGSSFVFGSHGIGGTIYIHEHEIDFVPAEDMPDHYEQTDPRTGEEGIARCWEMYNEYE